MAVIFVILWYNRMTCKKRADHGELPGIAMEDLERRCSDGLYHPLSVPSGGSAPAARGDALAGLWLEGQKYFLGSLKEPAEPMEGHPVLLQAGDWLSRYFAGERPDSGELKLDPGGGEFRRTVWEELCRIPYGSVTTYGALARTVAARLGRASMSAQAVGGAVGHNPISILIPCHRVVGADGSLTGYAGGIDKKLWLLDHEGVETDRFFVPDNSTAP